MSTDCYVNRSYYPHMFLIPAIIIVAVLSFFKKRTSFKKHFCGGRPGIVIPVDFLGVDHDRLAIAAVFGAATGSIFTLVVVDSLSSGDAWTRAFFVLGVAVEVAVLYYPFFACLTTNRKIIGPIMGFFYSLTMFIVNMLYTFDKCQNFSLPLSYLVVFFGILPIIICKLFLLGKYGVLLYKEVRRARMPSGNPFLMPEEESKAEVEFVKPWLRQYVKDLLKPRSLMLDTKIVYYLRKIYSKEKNFRFSTQTLSTVMICGILTYMFSFIAFSFSIVLFDANVKTELEEVVDGAGVALLVSAFISTIFCVVSIVRFMECHKNNMLRMFRGDKSFLPKSFSTSQFMVGESLRYTCYQIGYFIWAYILLLMLFFLIAAFGYSLAFSEVRSFALSGIKYLVVIGSVALLLWITLPIAAITIFRDQSFSKNVIAINNSDQIWLTTVLIIMEGELDRKLTKPETMFAQLAMQWLILAMWDYSLGALAAYKCTITIARNIYLVFSYFWFFVGLPMGLLSAVSRILKAMVIGSLMLPRIDRSIMPEGFHTFDQGFHAYVCYLYVQAAYRNPVLRVFCQILYDTRRTNSSGSKTSLPTRRVRNKWCLLLTLIHNPRLAAERKHALAQMPVVKIVNSDVTIHVSKYGTTNNSEFDY